MESKPQLACRGKEDWEKKDLLRAIRREQVPEIAYPQLRRVFDMLVVAGAFRDNDPPDDIDDDKGHDHRQKGSENHRQPDNSRVDVEHFADTGADSGHFGIRF